MGAIDAGTPGEVRISTDVMIALSHLYNSSPSIQAARTILLGQLLSSGLVVRRSGKDVELKNTFSRHIEDVWLPFARGIIDNFLQFGFVVVSLEEEDPPPFSNLINGKKMAAVSNSGGGDYVGGPGDASVARKRKLPIANDKKKSQIDIAEKKKTSNLIPVIPDLGQVDVSFIHTGITNYKRSYRIFVTDSDAVRTLEPFASSRLPLCSGLEAGCVRCRSIDRTFPAKFFLNRHPTPPAISSRPSPRCFNRRRSSRRSRNWLSKPKWCAPDRCL